MPRPTLAGPTDSNRINLDAQHLVRYWRAELGCGEDALRDAVAAVGTQAADVRGYLERQQRARPNTSQQGARP